VTPLPYHYLKARGEDVYNKFNAAALKGGATLRGDGITPGFFNERLAMLMTGLSNDVQMISMQEFFNAELLAASLPTLQLLGFGSSKEAVEGNPIMAMFAENYLKQPILFAAEKLGFKVERIDRTAYVKTAPAAIKTPFMTIEAGSVGLVSYAWNAFANGKPFYRTEVFWYMGEVMRPAEARCDDFWTVTVEGRPSLRVSVEGQSAFTPRVGKGMQDPAPPGYVMTVIALVQAIPAVVAAPPGLMLPAMPEIHWKRDMRI
jgi:2,4-diaminopentanoate dehydrogenase